MKKSFKKVIATVIAVVVIATSMLAFASCGGGATNYAENNTKIVIGCSGPLTGGAAIYGQAVYNSAKLAVEEINANGGLDGIMFEFVMQDDKHDPNNVASAYANMYENGMQISIGTVTTAPGLEYKELAYEDNVFYITPSATGDAIPEYDNAFQMCFADSNQGTASAEYFNTNYQGKTVGVFYKNDDPYSKGIYDKFKAALDSSFDLKEASFKGEESDFNTQVQTLKDCDVIFMPIYTTPASQFMIVGKNVVKANAIYFGCDGLDGIDAVEGFDITSVPQEVSYLSHFDSASTTGAAAEFIAKYNAKYDEKAQPLNHFGASAYDCIYAIFEALKTAKAQGKEFGVTTSASDFCDILKEIFSSDFTFNGITGKPTESGKSVISWQANGFVNKEADKYVVKESNAQ